MKPYQLPVSSGLLLDQIVSYGRKAPAGLETLPANALIRMIRRGLRMTQAQLAKRAGIPQSHLAVIEVGKADLKLGTLRKITKALGGELVLAARFPAAPAALVEKAIHDTAVRKVARVAGTMALEKQLPPPEATRRLVKSEEERLRRGPSSEIWED